MPDVLCKLHVFFEFTNTGDVQVKEFLAQKLPDFLLALQESDVEIRMLREESFRTIVEAQTVNEAMLKRILNDFCKNYSSPDKSCLLTLPSKTSLTGKIKVRNLGQALHSNEVLLEIFWPVIVLKTPKLIMDFSSGFRNFLILSGSFEILEQSKKIISSYYPNAKFESIV